MSIVSQPDLLVLIFLDLHKMMSLVGYQNVRGFFLLEENKVTMASIALDEVSCNWFQR